MVAVFREVRRVLRDDGTCWINLGDSYARAVEKGGSGPNGKHDFIPDYGKARAAMANNSNGREALPESAREGSSDGEVGRADRPGTRAIAGGLKPKDLVGIPWRVAFALQADGWYLRQDIIWAKPNPMPESVRDRCTKSHEYIFLLAKSERYYFDAEAIHEPFAESTLPRAGRAQESLARADGVPGQSPHSLHNQRAKLNTTMDRLCADVDPFHEQPASERGSTFTKGKTAEIKPTVVQGERVDAAGRNKRSVWIVATQPFKEAHFASFPPALIEPCILAGCPEGGTVLDPFGGAGTTGLVADRLHRDAILIELNASYADIARKRITGDSPLFAEVSA
jgi:DNA modification methylase